MVLDQGDRRRSESHPRFLLPGYALSEIFRAKLREAFTRAGLDREIDPRVWTRPWTVHLQQIGSGEHAARYLARSVYHVALSNHRLDRFEDGRVTFRYTHANTQEMRRLTLPVEQFIARVLHHVLPRGFTTIRYYGLLSPTGRADLERARHLLDSAPHAPLSFVTTETTRPDSTLHDPGVGSSEPASAPPASPSSRRCPVCRRGQLRLLTRSARSRAPPS